jgi:gluconate 5-dehydrogenase
MTRSTSDLFSLTGRRALITGGGGVIGTILAHGLADAGAIVGVQDLTLEKAEAVGAPHAFAADVSSVEECRSLVGQATEAMGGIDILVNCAGINRRKMIDDVTPDDFDAIVSVNMRAVFFLCQAVHETMRANGGGSIVNISSLSAKYSYQTISVYAASKAAVSSMTRSFAQEWASDNIRVNCIEPAVIRTEFTKPLWEQPHRQRFFNELTPLGRLMEPEETLGAVLYLASDASSYVTGQAITLEGGITTGANWDQFEPDAP